MSRLLLLLAAAAAVLGPSPAASVYIETRYGNRNYFCRDRFGFVGDCGDGKYRQRDDYDYGYREDRFGRKVGDGLYNMIGDDDAEMVCDFARDGRVKDDVVDIVWWKVYDEDDDRRRGRSRRHDLRDDRRYDRRDDRRYGRRDDRRYDRRDDDRYDRRDDSRDDDRYDRRDDDRYDRRYRYAYRRHYDDPHYRRARHYDYRPGMQRDNDYINGYRDWYKDDQFRSSLRVFTQGGRSILYIRDIQPGDIGLYRCQGRLRSRGGRYGRSRDDDTVYMDVEFYPVPKHD